MTFIHRLQAIARAQPDAAAVVTDDGRSFTYEALLSHAHHVAHALESLDLRFVFPRSRCSIFRLSDFRFISFRCICFDVHVACFV